MAPTVVTCPNCARSYKIPPERLGHKLKCKCGHVWVAQSPTAPQTAEPVAVAQPVEPERTAAQGKSETPTRSARKTSNRAQEEARKLIGRELGSFRIEDLLGIGGFGAVYRAFDKSLRRNVALKVLPPNVARARKEKIQHFLQEARSAAKLSHPNIVTVHQICQVEELYFIVMELVDGRSLAEVVRQKRLTPQEATRIITEAARGLAHAHRRGLIHRDIKPGNIMVTSDNQVKMTDFGLARDIFRDTSEFEEGRAVGTPLYMAPEQCEGEDGDSRSDVYSLAATYYVALTRRPPYEGRDTEEVMNRHRFDSPPDPRKVIPGLPAAVFRIIEKAMAKEPDERYQSAGDLLGVLEGLDFESLDPNATVNLEAVSAQIGAVTPQVGSHVGAVMKQAARRVDKSTSGIRMVETIEKVNPLKWYVIGGVLVAVVCIAAVILAIILADRGNGDGDDEDLTQVGSIGTAKVKQPAEQSSQETPDRPIQPKSVGTPKEEPAPQQEPGQQATVATVKPKEGEAEAKKSIEELILEGARQTFEDARRWEREAWATNPLSVIEKYEILINTKAYKNTEYVKKAQARLDFLQGNGSANPEDQDSGDDTSEEGQTSDEKNGGLGKPTEEASETEKKPEKPEG